MSPIEALSHVRDRLAAGEPLCILIGFKFYDAMEIVPGPAYLAGIRATLAADIDRRIAELSPPDPPAAAPGIALPVPAERTA